MGRRGRGGDGDVNVINAIVWLIPLALWFRNYVVFLASGQHGYATLSAAFAVWSAMSAALAVTA